MIVQFCQAFCFCFITVTVAKSFQAFGQHEYYYGGQVESYEEAESECGDRNGSLAIVNSKEIRDFLVNNIINISFPFSFYIGLRRVKDDSNNNDAFEWIDGTSLSGGYEDWHTGEPNNQPNNVDSNERCVIMGWFYELDADYKWRDVECDRRSRFICQNNSLSTMSERSTTPTQIVPTLTPSLSYSSTTNSNISALATGSTPHTKSISVTKVETTSVSDSFIAITSISTTIDVMSTSSEDDSLSPTEPFVSQLLLNLHWILIGIGIFLVGIIIITLYFLCKTQNSKSADIQHSRRSGLSNNSNTRSQPKSVGNVEEGDQIETNAQYEVIEGDDFQPKTFEEKEIEANNEDETEIGQDASAGKATNNGVYAVVDKNKKSKKNQQLKNDM